MNKWDRLNLLALILGITALFIERASPSPALATALHILDFGILALLYWSEVGEIRQASYRWNYVRKHWPSIAFLAGFTALFLYSKYISFFVRAPSEIGWLTPTLRNIFLVLKVFGRFKKIYVLFERLSSKPAQTVIVSFLLVILVGALVLMTPPATTNGTGLSFVEALFTATSAVCVTGLAVVDTAVAFTVLGQATILGLS